MQRSLTVTLPIAVQPNPGVHELANVKCTAQSDVTFGYLIAIATDAGPRIIFERKLRLQDGEPSLYHTAETGESALINLPYQTEPVVISSSTPTSVPLVDPTGKWRLEGAAVEDRAVTFSCVVKVYDRKNKIDEDSIKPQRGVIEIEVISDSTTNYSFEVSVSVAETVGVDGDGKPVTESEKEPKVFMERHTIPMDARVLMLPTAFFEQNASEARQLWKTMNDFYYKYSPKKPAPPEPLEVSNDYSVYPKERINPVSEFKDLINHFGQILGLEISEERVVKIIGAYNEAISVIANQTGAARQQQPLCLESRSHD